MSVCNYHCALIIIKLTYLLMTGSAHGLVDSNHLSFPSVPDSLKLFSPFACIHGSTFLPQKWPENLLVTMKM